MASECCHKYPNNFWQKKEKFLSPARVVDLKLVWFCPRGYWSRRYFWMGEGEWCCSWSCNGQYCPWPQNYAILNVSSAKVEKLKLCIVIRILLFPPTSASSLLIPCMLFRGSLLIGTVVFAVPTNVLLPLLPLANQTWLPSASWS